MSSTVVAKNLQVGADGTASNNFTIYQPASPDGTLRIGNGNTGTTSAQVVLTSAGNVGIGTSSPTGIGASYRNLVISGPVGSSIDLNDGSGTVRGVISTDNSGGNALFIETRTSHPIIFRTTASNIERMRINAGAPILCLAGGNTSATGTGIAFPATQSASSDANTLDDYEEGTFTPTLAFNGNSTGITYNSQSGNYTKIGNMVRVFATIGLTNKGSASGIVQMTGLPFTCIDAGNPAAAIYGNLSGISSEIIPYLSGTTVNYEVINTGVQSALLNTNVNNSSSFFVSITYRTAG
jgi:hypothetical protein